MSRQRSALPSRQRGISFWHILILIITAVGLALCAKNNSVPYFQKPLNEIKNDIKIPGIPTFNFQNSVPATSSGSSGQDSFSPDNSDDNNVEWLLTSHKTTQVQTPPVGSTYELEYPRDLTHGFYTVQVFSGYNSKSAYDLRKALRQDGYKSYIHQQPTRQGILFKVRVGQYKNRSDAFAMNTKIRLSYPNNMKNSFVLLRQ